MIALDVLHFLRRCRNSEKRYSHKCQGRSVSDCVTGSVAACCHEFPKVFHVWCLEFGIMCYIELLPFSVVFLMVLADCSVVDWLSFFKV